MKKFPTTLGSEPSYVSSDSLGPSGKVALQSLHEKGYHIQIGILEADIPQLQALSLQASIRKYCPKDCTERFKDEPTVKKWLTKKRLVFLLKEKSTSEVAGIAWTGPGTSSHIPGGKLTGGVRLSEEHQGKGLAAPFLRAELEYTQNEYSAELLWFECWESNAGAAHIYQKIGFEVVNTETAERPTPSGPSEQDTRIYMRFTHERKD